MLNKELREILKPTMLRLLPLPAAVLIIILKIPLDYIFHFPLIRVFKIFKQKPELDYLIFLLITGAFVIVLIAGFYGFSAFHHEHRDKAFEYLFSFPVSKMNILKFKLIPRIPALLFLIAAYEVAAGIFIVPIRSIQSHFFFLIDPVFFPVVAAYFFLCGFILCVYEQKNGTAVTLMAAVLTTIFMALGIKNLLGAWPAVQFSTLFRNGISFVASSILLLFSLGKVSFSIFFEMDSKPAEYFGRRFSLRALPLLAVLLAGGIFLMAVF